MLCHSALFLGLGDQTPARLGLIHDLSENRGPSAMCITSEYSPRSFDREC